MNTNLREKINSTLEGIMENPYPESVHYHTDQILTLISKELKKMKEDKNKFLKSAKDEDQTTIQCGLAYCEGYNDAISYFRSLLTKQEKEVKE